MLVVVLVVVAVRLKIAAANFMYSAYFKNMQKHSS